jgi:hypothetical protein
VIICVCLIVILVWLTVDPVPKDALGIP